MVAFLSSLLVLAQAESQTLQIDPLLMVEASEVWSVIGSAKNPVWPGWNAQKTPVMIYFPNKQEVLINHPNPPKGFVPYTGSLRSPIGNIFIRNGKTETDLDGQNTSMEIGGVETLVIADTQSTKRQWIASIADAVIKDPAKANETIESGLFGNPISQMTMFAHEAFHVYQRHVAPKRGGNELALTKYPTLSVENNSWLVMEAEYLKDALLAKNDDDFRKSAVRWMASRDARRIVMDAASAAYEDGTEFNEGLANYVEYRTLQVMEGKKPNQNMWLIAGFPGYADLGSERNRLIQAMEGFMNGSRLVNNDPYGASPVRFRMYYSGMAIGVLLDRLGSKWHDRILKENISLTALANEALHISPDEMKKTANEIRATDRFKEVWGQKTKLAETGAEYISKEVEKFSSGPGELVIDYSQLKEPKVGFAFTPFGILSVDADRTIYRLIPIRGLVGALTFSEDSARPILHDTKRKLVRIQLTGKADLAAGAVDTAELSLPGVSLKAVKGGVTVEGNRVTLLLRD